MWLKQWCATGPETSPVQSGVVRVPMTSRSASADSATSTGPASPSANCSCQPGSGEASSKTRRIPRRYGPLIFSSGSRPSSPTSIDPKASIPIGQSITCTARTAAPVRRACLAAQRRAARAVGVSSSPTTIRCGSPGSIGRTARRWSLRGDAVDALIIITPEFYGRWAV